MGRKDFLNHVNSLSGYFVGLNRKSKALVKDLAFNDPELHFSFSYKSRKFFTVQILVNDSLSSYPQKFSGFICIDGKSDSETDSAAKLVQTIDIENKSVGEMVAIITQKLCDHFRIKIPKDLSLETLRQHGGSTVNAASSSSQIKLHNADKSFIHHVEKPIAPITRTPYMLLQRDLEELKHWKYHGELLCADEIGFKVSISMPVNRLGLSLEACEAWNLDPDRYIVCTMQFSPNYIDLEGVVANAHQSKAYLIKQYGYSAVKEDLKKQFRVTYTVLTSTLAKGLPSLAHHKDDHLESDHFVLSWTLTELLRSKFFDMLCDRIWFGIGWGGAEYADLKRNKEHNHDFLNNEMFINGEIDACLLQNEESHGQLCYLEAERNEISSASKNQNFLLLILRFLRRRILLSTKYCLTCHYPHTESVSSIRPFVCGNPLCQHQALVGLGNLFEAVLVNSPVVVDLLISLCYVAIQSRNLNPFPSKAIGVTSITKHEIKNSLTVDWNDNQGFVGKASALGYEVYSWEAFDDQIRVNDLLEVYSPETGQPFTVNRSNQTTTVRVLEVTSSHLITDFQISFPVSALPSKPIYLPFRIHRRTELNFLVKDQSDQPDYATLQSIIDRLPPVTSMVQYAKKKILKSELDKLNLLCFPLLSWIISSNRTHLRLLESDDEKVQFNEGTGSYGNWKQFIMIMSSPEKEETFQHAKEKLRAERAGQYLGELFAFHGSPLTNWHSIIRTSLNYKRVAHGRIYGDGVYHSLQANTSASYAGGMPQTRYEPGVWKNSMLVVTKCMALCEIVNRPSQFISTNPHLVVQDESWITTRYLFVECLRDPTEPISDDCEEDDWTPNVISPNMTYMPTFSKNPIKSTITSFAQLRQRSNRPRTEFIRLDANYTPVWLNNQPLQVPKHDFSIIANEAPNGSSMEIGPFHYQFKAGQSAAKPVLTNYSPTMFHGGTGFEEEIMEEEDDVTCDDTDEESPQKTKGKGKDVSDEDEAMDDEEDDGDDDDDYYDYDNFDDDSNYFQETTQKTSHYQDDDLDDDGFDPSLLPLPNESSKTATQRICKELRQIVQKQTNPTNDLAFSLNTDKLVSMYQWVVQLKDFDPSLPLAQDMKRHKVKTIDLEVRFAPDYPFVPPYIRLIRPRLLRFMEGGGGHVTAGGSICMDLLTLGNQSESGWTSAYTMEAVLLQVKMALSSLEPKPARLDPRQWNSEYSPREAIDAYIRVAAQHNWRVPPQWAALFGR